MALLILLRTLRPKKLYEVFLFLPPKDAGDEDQELPALSDTCKAPALVPPEAAAIILVTASSVPASLKDTVSGGLTQASILPVIVV